MYGDDNHTWSQWHSFSEKTGITIGSSIEGIESLHFKDARAYLKHLRTKFPNLVFKSEKWYYYGAHWTIKVRDQPKENW